MDKGYDSEKVRDKARARERGATPLIIRRYNSKAENSDIDWCFYIKCTKYCLTLS